jgi:hypothetical protein
MMHEREEEEEVVTRRQRGRNKRVERLALAGLLKFYQQQQLADFCLLAVSSIKTRPQTDS